MAGREDNMANNGYNNFHGRPDDPSQSYAYSYQYNGSSGTNRSTRNRKKKDGQGLPIPLIVFGFFINPLLGISLLVAHLVMIGVITNSAPGKIQFISSSQARARQAAEAAEIQQMTPKEQMAQQAQALEQRSKKTRLVSIFLILLGGVLTLGGFSMVVESLSWIIPYGAYSSDIVALIWGALTTGGGITAIRYALKMRREMRFKTRILSVVGKNTVMDLRDIAQATGINKKECQKQVQDCVDKGLFGWGAYLDLSSNTLFTGAATAQQRTDAKKEKIREKQEAKAAREEAKKANSKYQAILDQLEALDEAIPGEEMSAKIRRLAQVSQKIFELVEQNPEKLPRLRKFMDYYLPTSLKLLTSYSQLDAQGVEGDNITEAKTRIENAMDTLTTAFENQLDKLFEEDALDISSDITAMEGMLRADGLAGDFPEFNLPGGDL